jgi:hypothetical protein
MEKKATYAAAISSILQFLPEHYAGKLLES